jgi:hypothetical protein
MAGSWGVAVQWARGDSEDDILTAVHMVLLRTGKVLIWGYGKRYVVDNVVHYTTPDCWLWDSATEDFPEELTDDHKPNDHNIMLCAGHCALPDGRVLVAGGQDFTEVGTPFGDIFDPDESGLSTTPASPACRPRS